MFSSWSESWIELLRAASPIDAPDNIYIVTEPESKLDQYRGAAMYTSGYLDYVLQSRLEELGLWTGPGLTIVVCQPWTVTTGERVGLGIMLHEWAHFLDVESTNTVRPLAAEDPKAWGPQIVKRVGAPANYKPDADEPRWLFHESNWIRAATHLYHRSARFSPIEIVAGETYGLSSGAAYRTALGAELEDAYDTPIVDILKTPAPAEFEKLWLADTTAV